MICNYCKQDRDDVIIRTNLYTDLAPYDSLCTDCVVQRDRNQIARALHAWDHEPRYDVWRSHLWMKKS